MQFINSIIKDVIETNDGDISINDILQETLETLSCYGYDIDENIASNLEYIYEFQLLDTGLYCNGELLV